MTLQLPFPPKGEFTYDVGGSLRDEVSEDIIMATHNAAGTSRKLSFTKEMLILSHSITIGMTDVEAKERYAARGAFSNGARLGIEAFFRSDLDATTAQGVLDGFSSLQGSMLTEFPAHQKLMSHDTRPSLARNMLINCTVKEQEQHPETGRLRLLIHDGTLATSHKPLAAEYAAYGYGYATYLLDIGTGNIQNPPDIQLPGEAGWEQMAKEWLGSEPGA